MTVTKTTREAYEIWKDHEYATITLKCWDRPVGEKETYYCGEIMINSSFGSWANTWTACASPFKKFLIRLDFGYFFSKLAGTSLEKFDGEASVKEMFKILIERRKSFSMSRLEAREAWQELEFDKGTAESDERSFGDAMMAVAQALGEHHPMHDDFADPSGWPKVTKPDCQAVGFWEKIWPEFVAELKKEIANEHVGR